MLRCIGKQSGGIRGASPEEKKVRLRWKEFAEKECFVFSSRFKMTLHGNLQLRNSLCLILEDHVLLSFVAEGVARI